MKTRAVSERHAKRSGGRAPLLLCVLAAILLAFLLGAHVLATGIFPSSQLRSAYKTLIVNLEFMGLRQPRETRRRARPADCAPAAANLVNGLRRDFQLNKLLCPSRHVARADAAAAHIEFIVGDALAEPVLVKGEIGTFLDHCPGAWGCLAVQYARSGSVSHAWPARLEAIAAANIAAASAYPYEHPLGWSFPRDLLGFHISPYPNGDLLVVFHFNNSHPDGGGVARVAPDGWPRWYRKDYSHHWPHVVSDDLALVPGEKFQRHRLEYTVGPGHGGVARTLRCDDGMIQEDLVHVINGRGDLLEEISIIDAIVASSYAGTLVDADDCDPIHLNFARVLGEDASGTAGIAPGDLVVSLRNLSAFGILDKKDRRLKKLVRGSFHWQHGVRHLDGARFAMLDNLGSDGVLGPSRLLLVDIATGQETTLFPTATTPSHLRDWFVFTGGQFDISADRRRALLSDPSNGRALEIRLADGEVLNVFRQMHDLSGLPGFPEMFRDNAWLFSAHGVHYANGWVP